MMSDAPATVFFRPGPCRRHLRCERGSWAPLDPVLPSPPFPSRSVCVSPHQPSVPSGPIQDSPGPKPMLPVLPSDAGPPPTASLFPRHTVVRLAVPSPPPAPTPFLSAFTGGWLGVWQGPRRRGERSARRSPTSPDLHTRALLPLCSRGPCHQISTICQIPQVTVIHPPPALAASRCPRGQRGAASSCRWPPFQPAPPSGGYPTSYVPT
jgi:hypothetical protein